MCFGGFDQFSPERPGRISVEQFELLRRMWRETCDGELPLRYLPSEAEASRISLLLLRKRLSFEESLTTWLDRIGNPGRAPCGTDLPMRLRSILRLLLTGASEQQIAHGLRLERRYVHEDVRSLYEHFQVAGRDELLTRWIWRGFARQGTRAAV